MEGNLSQLTCKYFIPGDTDILCGTVHMELLSGETGDVQKKFNVRCRCCKALMNSLDIVYENVLTRNMRN